MCTKVLNNSDVFSLAPRRVVEVSSLPAEILSSNRELQRASACTKVVNNSNIFSLAPRRVVKVSVIVRAGPIL